MEIKISEQGQDYLNKRGYKIITLEITTSGGGCCPTFESYEISFKPPDGIEHFHVFDVDQIKVYLDKKAKVITPILQFDVEKKLLFSKWIVTGLALKIPT